MDDDTLLLEQESPDGSIIARVDSSAGAVHFYLCGTPDTDFGMKSCWVRNLVTAPAELELSRIQEGYQPLLPASCCAHPDGLPYFEPDSLSVLWFEEGDGAALFERNELLAVIPGWSGQGGFWGFARDCTAPNSLCWPMPEESPGPLDDKIFASREYWDAWDNEPSPWKQYQEAGASHLNRTFGRESNYYAIDGGHWPPKAALRFDYMGASVFCTLGVGLRAQPTVESYANDPSSYRRIELGIAILGRDIDPRTVGGFISGQAAFPWMRTTWLGPGHTVECSIFPKKLLRPHFEAALLIRDCLGAPKVDFTPFCGDPINTLWAIPITDSERELSMSAGSEELIKRLEAAGHSWIHRDRRPVA